MGSVRRWVLYLAAAGVGTIGVVDDDVVDLSNLQRQVAHTTARIGMSKVASAAAAATAINPGVVVEGHAMRLSADNALDLIGRYDIVCDGTDNFATRFLVADACALARRTLVSARCCGSRASFRCSSRTRAGRAIAACIRSLRRLGPCRPAVRPACLAR